MRLLLLYFFIFLSSSLSGQSKKSFPFQPFDKVVFYDFKDVVDNSALIIDKNGKLLQTIIKEVEINSSAIKQLNKKIGDKKSYGATTASCFNPHCGFVYFLEGKAVAQVTICLECNRLYSTIEIPAQKQGKQGEGEHVYYLFEGLSKSFRKFINELLVENKFSHQIEEGSIFDK